MNFGASEMLLVLVVVLLLFGGKRLPELARSIGKGLAEFRRATQEIQREINNPLKDPPPATPATSESNSSAESNPPTVHAHPAAQPRPSEDLPGSDT
jgi:sec-independent protein translocase protein TatA